MPVRNAGDMLPPMRFLSASGALLAFVAVSILIHTAVLLLLHDSAPKQAHRHIGSSVISAILYPAKNSPAVDQTIIPSASPVRKKPVPDKPEIRTGEMPPMVSVEQAISQDVEHNTLVKAGSDHKREQERIETSPTENTAAKTADSSRPSTSASVEPLQDQRNYLLGEVQHRLRKYLSYPPRARRRGWQGEVHITFHINKQGQLNNIHLAKSSGYSLLDHAALSAIGKLKNISLPDELGTLQAMDLLLPVRYQLQEG
ncbi:MAG TPA: energy transducer TonB [Gammaproteobacteria bacterium]|nr:energy transducer TonB [Gammaproteobacteria bacterium]